MALLPCACAVGLRRPQVRTRLCVPRESSVPQCRARRDCLVTVLGRRTLERDRPAGAGARAFPGRRAAAHAGTRTPGKAGRLLLEQCRTAAPGGCAAWPPTFLPRVNAGAHAGLLYLRCSPSPSCARRPRGLCLRGPPCLDSDKLALLLSRQVPKRTTLECNTSISFKESKCFINIVIGTV